MRSIHVVLIIQVILSIMLLAMTIPIHPKVSTTLKHVLSLSSNQPVNVWVFFKTRSTINQQYGSQIRSVLPIETIQRRSKVNTQIITEMDYPVDETYIQQVVNQLNNKDISRIRTRSRWLHAISLLDTTIDEIIRIAGLSCVTDIEIVSRYVKRNPDEKQDNVLYYRDSTSDNRRRIDSVHSSTELNYGLSYAQLVQINAIEAHKAGYNGTGVIILILDSGFRTSHTAFKNLHVIDHYDFVFNDPNVDNESEDDASQFRHGTQCLGLIGGVDPGNYYGIAFGARFLLAKTEDVRSETSTEEDNFVRALEWGEQRGADILSASLGYRTPMYPNVSAFDGKTAITTKAVNLAIQHGLTCVIAAGNEGSGPSTLGSPGDAFESITVGAVNAQGTVTSFSSRGPTYDQRIKPEVCALGSSNPVVNPSDPNTYSTNSGTSFATPLVAGAAALILEANPTWGPRDIRKALMKTASRTDNPDNSYGWGIIDVMQAIQYSAPKQCPGKQELVDDQCVCPDGFFGENCDYVRDSCEINCEGICVSGEVCIQYICRTTTNYNSVIRYLQLL